MTTYVAFNPQTTSNFQFNVVLDGVAYVAICVWNLYGQRYYIQIYNTSQTLIMMRPIVGSPPDYDINLLSGYFTTSTMVYRVATGNFEINP